MILAWFLGLLAFSTAAFAAAYCIRLVQERLRPWIERVAIDAVGHELAALERRFDDLQEGFDGLPATWEQVRDETIRLHNRARHHVRRISKELEARGLEEGEIDGLSEELGLSDDEGSGDQGMLELPGLVEKEAEAAPETAMSRAFQYKWSRRSG